MKFRFLAYSLLFLLLSCSSEETIQSITLSNGIVRFENFNSKFIKPRNIDIGLPKDYSRDKEYAVLYMHDGQMLFDSTTTWNKQEWNVDAIMQQLLDKDKIRATIVVGIANTELRHSEYFPQQPFESLPQTFQDSLLNLGERSEGHALFKAKILSDNYLKFIVQELKPFIDKTYTTYSNRENTFIAGSSMGGLISMYALCEYPTVFGGAACLSTHWVGTFDTLNNPIPAQFATYLKEHLPNPRNHKLYFDYGTETLDALYEPYQQMVDSVMVNGGYDENNWKTLKFEGANHSEKAWNARLHIPLEFLLSE